MTAQPAADQFAAPASSPKLPRIRKPVAKPVTEAPVTPADQPAEALAPVGTETEAPAPATKTSDKQNGISRPRAGGKCAAVWDALDKVEGRVTAEQVRALAAEHGFDKTTAQVQFYRWRKFNGIAGR